MTHPTADFSGHGSTDGTRRLDSKLARNEWIRGQFGSKTNLRVKPRWQDLE